MSGGTGETKDEYEPEQGVCRYRENSVYFDTCSPTLLQNKTLCPFACEGELDTIDQGQMYK